MKHILIVEDDTTFAVMLQTWLSKKKIFGSICFGNCSSEKNSY